jgi:hypothetical protein
LEVYTKELADRKEVIIEQKVTLDQFQQIVTKLQLQVATKDEKLYEARKQIQKLKFSHIARTVIEVGVIILIIAL